VLKLQFLPLLPNTKVCFYRIGKMCSTILLSTMDKAALENARMVRGNQGKIRATIS
jgi:hypothetical protein